MEVTKFLKKVQVEDSYHGQIVHKHTIPTRAARFAELDPPLPAKLAKILKGTGIEKLYVHQVDAVKHLRAGADVVIVTSTASGKTLCYNIPVLSSHLEDPRPGPSTSIRRRRSRRISSACCSATWVRAASSSRRERTTATRPPRSRRKLRDEAKILLTNPDMLHSGILPNHAKWANFFSRLQYVVIDEIHTYRGIFGSHMPTSCGGSTASARTTARIP